jgi:hypothetical protein
MLEPDMIAEDFATWMRSHPDRVGAAQEALAALNQHAESALVPNHLAAFTDVLNLLNRATGRD